MKSHEDELALEDKEEKILLFMALRIMLYINYD